MYDFEFSDLKLGNTIVCFFENSNLAPRHTDISTWRYIGQLDTKKVYSTPEMDQLSPKMDHSTPKNGQFNTSHRLRIYSFGVEYVSVSNRPVPNLYMFRYPHLGNFRKIRHQKQKVVVGKVALKIGIKNI